MVGVLEWFTDRARRKEREEWVGQEPGLMSYQAPMPRTQAGLFDMDPMTGQSTLGQNTANVYHPGQGLLGGQMTQPAYEARLSTQNNQAARNYMERGMMERGQMARQMQDQDWQEQNMTAYQQAQVGVAQMQNRIANMNASYDDLIQTRKAYTSEAAPYTDALRAYDTVSSVVAQKPLEAFDGPEDYGLIVAYSKMAKPGEQLTEGEFDKLGESLGIPGLFAKFMGAASGKGTLGLPERQAIYNAMRSRVGYLESGLNEVNKTYDQITRSNPFVNQRYRLDPQVRDSGQLPVSPRGATEQQYDRGTTNIQTPQPVTSRP